MAAREAKAEASGKTPRGRPPQPPAEGPLPTDQINLTDEDSRIMPVAGGGFEQCYNAQAVVAAGTPTAREGGVVQEPGSRSAFGI
jgi:hypothetical protein